MIITNKKKTAIASSIAAIFVTATLALFGISGDEVIEVDYEITSDEQIAEMSVNPPEELGVDIVELYCNGKPVTKALLPNGKLKTLPFIFSDLSNTELRFYRLNEVVGIGNFDDDDKLYCAIKDGALPKDSEVTDDAEE